MNHFVVMTAHGKPTDATCLWTSGIFSLKMKMIKARLPAQETMRKTKTN
jgi:hypothetical protein